MEFSKTFRAKIITPQTETKTFSVSFLCIIICRIVKFLVNNLEKCATLVMEKGKIVKSVGIE